MKNRIAIIGIVVENIESSVKVNEILHLNSEYILGRMGLPKIEKDVNLISVIVKAPYDKIEEITSKLAEISNVSAKAVYSSEK